MQSRLFTGLFLHAHLSLGQDPLIYQMKPLAIATVGIFTDQMSFLMPNHSVKLQQTSNKILREKYTSKLSHTVILLLLH